VRSAFFELADALCRNIAAHETLLCSLAAESSDFVRFNHARVRQSGSVIQRYLTLRLVREGRQASATLALSGESGDLALANDSIGKLREVLAQLPPDPWLLYSTEARSTSNERRSRLPPAEDVVQHVAKAAGGTDFVGFYAAGTIARAFANSLGQRNWHEVETFNFDWSLHLQDNRAVKDGYSGFEWDASVFERRLRECQDRLELMKMPARTLPPADYRAYLAPRALEEVTGLLQGDAFSARAQKTQQSALLRMAHGERLSPFVSLIERIESAVAPGFQNDGYVRPDEVSLIAEGRLAEALVCARSAREYGLQVNGANGRETPEALEMAAGPLESAEILYALGTGLYISNLWYLNYSDKPAARMTGMTRFATFWVENGRIVCPVTPLRFDDSLYRMLGENLEALTRERELLLSTSTYDERSTSSARLPGALLGSLRFTL
jgi:predicted Zn-dependent protease